MDTLKVPTNPWPNPSSFLPSVLSYPDITRIACIRETTNCKISVAAQGRIAADVFQEKELQRKGRELLVFSCPHQKTYFHRKS